MSLNLKGYPNFLNFIRYSEVSVKSKNNIIKSFLLILISKLKINITEKIETCSRFSGIRGENHTSFFTLN